MKLFYFFIITFVLLVCNTLSINATPSRAAGTTFIAGGELRLAPVNNSDTVRYELILYRDCASSNANATNGDRLLVIFQSQNCCTTIIDTAKLDISLSEVKAYPFCPGVQDVSTCYVQSNINYVGFRKEVYVGYIKLSCRASDWRVGHLYNNVLANQNFLQKTSFPAGLGNALQQITNTPTPLSGVPNFTCRVGYSNTVSTQNDPIQGFFYIEAFYNNTVNNTTPKSTDVPFMFQCMGNIRKYDLGFYDVEHHRMQFSLATPYRDAPTSFAGSADPMLFFGPCDQANPLCNTSYINIDQNTGIIELRGDQIGVYRTSIRIDEYDDNNLLVSTTFKDIAIVINNEQPNCSAMTNQVANLGHFLSYYTHLNNCAPVYNETSIIEACPGNSIQFAVVAESYTPENSEVLNIISDDKSSVISSANSTISMIYHPHNAPYADTTEGVFTWNIPANTPAGLYYVKFKINECTKNYLLSNEKVVFIRVNSPTKITWAYQNVTLDTNIINLPNSKRMLSCKSAPSSLIQVTNGQKKASFQWTITGIPDVDISNSTSTLDSDAVVPNIASMPSTTGTLIVQSNQYCNNRDTLVIVNKPNIDPAVTISATYGSACYYDTVTLSVTPYNSTYQYMWQTNSGVFTPPPINLSNEVTSVFTTSQNNYQVYVMTSDTCIASFYKRIDLLGVKPKSSFITDKQYVCPGDSIYILPFYTSAICGLDKFNKAVANSNSFVEYPGSASSTLSTPKVFTSSSSIIHMKTQFVYTAKELQKKGFKPGIIRSLGFHIEGISKPNIYNNIQIRVKCTDRNDFIDSTFQDTSLMMKLVDLNSAVLSVGWNDFSLGGGFTWDGLTNLVFDVMSTCSKPNPGDIASSPAYSENITNFISVIGRYGIDYNTFQSNKIVTSYNRPNIRWEAYHIDSSIIKFAWSDSIISPTPPKTLNSYTISNPVINTKITRKYYVTLSIDKCSNTDSVVGSVNANYSIKLANDSVVKCPSDIVQIKDTPGVVPRLAFNFFCGVDGTNDLYKLYGFNRISPDTCRVYDTTFFPYYGVPTSALNDGLVSPFGGKVASVGDPTTDKRLQFLISASELRANTKMRKGIISRIMFDVVSGFANNDSMSNFSIKMLCVKDTMNQLYKTNFLNAALFQEVFYRDNFMPIFGKNYIDLDYNFGWDSTMGIMFDICYNNYTAVPFYSQLVRTQTLTQNKTLYYATNTPGSSTVADLGCAFVSGTLTKNRPNIEFTICAPTKPFPAIANSFNWIPTTYISNTKIQEPFVYNESSTKYYVILDYIDTNLGKSVVACRVDNVFNSMVNRPAIDFDPRDVVSCANKSTTVTAFVPGIKSSLYNFEWTASLGLDNTDLTNPKQIVTPPNPKYYYVKVSNLANPNCWNQDSIYVNIQDLKAMPDLGSASLICQGDTLLLTIPTNVGYKNPVWYYNGVIIDTGFTIKVSDKGSYQVRVDSGYCTNYSALKDVDFRQPGYATVYNSYFKLCQGDTAVLIYNISDGVTVPLWNNGVSSVINKVTQNGQYYLIKAKDMYGCDMIVKDTITVDIIANPSFSLQNDTLCVGLDKSILLVPDPIDPSASYTWSPTGETTPTINAMKPGIYTVERQNLSCIQRATAVVIADTMGKLNLGTDKATCCDEIISLDANPLGIKYKSYLWSTGDKSQIISTLPNTSGLYIVEAVKPNGCKDTGSIYISSKCTNLSAVVEKQEIQLGETNNIIGKQLDVNATNVIYNWIPSQEYNKILNGDKLNATAKPIDTGDAEYVLVMTVIDSNYMPPKPYCIENTVVRFKVKPNGLTNVNTFSPNGDGLNDEFYPEIKGNVRIKEFKIYNRFGQLMHDDVNKPWNGRFNNELQPIGVYVCILSYELVEPMKDPVVKYVQFNLTLIR